MSEPRVSAVRGAPTIHSHSDPRAQGHGTSGVLDLAKKKTECPVPLAYDINNK